MERYLQNTAATTSATFYEDGVAVDPGTVTVTITQEDGTALYTNAGTVGSGVNARTYNLTTSDTASLDMLRLDWRSSTKGTLTTYVEVVGGYLFSLSQARALRPLDNTTKYPTADIAAARTLAESALENACGVAFVPRYAREKVDGNSTTDILLRPRPLSITSATVGGATVDTTTLELYDDGRVYNAAKWSEGRRNITVKYAHGYSIVPPRVGRAALLLAKRFLVDTPVNDRATSITSNEGITERLVTAGVRDAVFDVPEANAIVAEYGVRFGVA